MGADPTAILDEPDDYKSPLVPAAITGGITRGPLYIMSTVTTRYSIPPLPMTSVSFTTRIHALFPTVTSSSNSITYTRVEEKEKPERPKRVSPRPPKTIDAVVNKKRHGAAAVCP